MSDTDDSRSDQDSYDDSGGGILHYDNPFVDDPRHNALFTLTRYQENIDELKDKLSGTFTLDDLEHLKDTVGEVNVGLKQCVEYVTLIGDKSDGLSGTIKVMWKAIPFIRKDLPKFKDWDERVKVTKLVSNLLKQTVDILETVAILEKEAKRISKKLQKANLELLEMEKQVAEEQRKAEKIQRKEREREEAEKKKVEDAKKKKEDEERKAKEEEEQRRKAEEDEANRQKMEEERKEKEEKERKEEEERKRKMEEERLKREEDDKRKREEHDKKKRDEERKRREEEVRKQRELAEKRNNPSTWPELRYEVEKIKDCFQSGLGCIVRDADGTLQKEQLECCVIPIKEMNFDFHSQEARVSNVINLKSRGDDTIVFGELQAQISIPYVHDRGRQREMQVYIKDGGTWNVTQATYTNLPEDEHRPTMKFAKFYVPSITDLTFFVGLMTVTSTKEFNKDGGKLQAMNDSKVTVNVMKNTFKKPGVITLKVIPKDAVNQARERVDNDEGQLMDASSVAYVTINGTPTKPVQVEINFPQREGTSSGRWRTTAPKDAIHVMTSSDGHHWIRSDPNERTPNDTFVVEVESSVKTVLLLRTAEEIQSPAAQYFARDIDDKLKQTAANLVMRHKDTDKTCVFVQCGARDKTGDLLDKLKERGYSNGPMPSNEFYIREGSDITLTFRGNVDFEKQASPDLNLTFTASLETARVESFVKVVDEYKQRDRDDYIGMLQLWSSKDNTDTGQATSRKQTMHGTLLCELPIAIPKDLKKSDRFRSSVYQGIAPLTKDYMNELAHELGHEWEDLAINLGLKRSTVQQIIQRNNHDPGDDLEHVKYDMLRTWHMQTTKGPSQVDQIMNALKQVKRHDLAGDLHRRNQEVAREKQKMARKQLFRDAVVDIGQDQAAVKNWRSILSDLGTDSSEISSIADQHGSVGNRKCLQEGIMDWAERKGANADTKELANVLTRLGHKVAAANMAHILRRP